MAASEDFRELLSKFLKYMTFFKSSSPETLRAYRTDLLQAFELKQSDLPRAEEFFQMNESVGSGVRHMLDEEWLMVACRTATKSWSALAPASRNRKAATLKSLLGWFHQEGLIRRDLAAQVYSPKVPVRLPHFLSVDEMQALLASLRNEIAREDGNLHFEDMLLLVLLLYGGGLRISEACNLKWASIAADARTLRILGKGRKERIVALPPSVALTLHNHRKSRGKGEFVFGDTPLDTRKGYEMVRMAGARAGLLKPLHPHALRHSFATHLLASGANLRSLQELLGHESLQATSRYTHLGIDQLARTLEDFHPLGPKNADRKVKS